VANDRDYGSQQKDQGNRPSRDKDQDRSQRDPNDGRQGERDVGSSDRGVERSDWNYDKPGTTKEKEKKASSDDFESDDDM
jgi:hypothetical protein